MPITLAVWNLPRNTTVITAPQEGQLRRLIGQSRRCHDCHLSCLAITWFVRNNSCQLSAISRRLVICDVLRVYDIRAKVKVQSRSIDSHFAWSGFVANWLIRRKLLGLTTGRFKAQTTFFCPRVTLYVYILNGLTFNWM